MTASVLSTCAPPMRSPMAEGKGLALRARSLASAPVGPRAADGVARDLSASRPRSKAALAMRQAGAGFSRTGDAANFISDTNAGLAAQRFTDAGTADAAGGASSVDVLRRHLP